MVEPGLFMFFALLDYYFLSPLYHLLYSNNNSSRSFREECRTCYNYDDVADKVDSGAKAKGQSLAKCNK